MTSLPQFQQQARERFADYWTKESKHTEQNWLTPDTLGIIKEFQDQLLSDFLLEIEKEVVPEEVSDPGDFGGEDDKLIREQWWGSELTRRHVFNAFKRLRGN